MEKLCPNPSKFIKNPSQINQNVSQERSENDLGSKSTKWRAPDIELWGILAPLGWFWMILGTLKIRQGTKNCPKNSIRRLFGALWPPKGGQKRFWKAFGTSMKSLSKIDAKMGSFGMQNHWFVICFIRFSCFWRFSKKCDFQYFAQPFASGVVKKATRHYGLSFVLDQGQFVLFKIRYFSKLDLVQKLAGPEAAGRLPAKMASWKKVCICVCFQIGRRFQICTYTGKCRFFLKSC